MNNLLSFMEAVKGNPSFVYLVLVLGTCLCILFITWMIQRRVRFQQKVAHEEFLEKSRVERAKAIVPIRRMGDEVQS